MVVVVIARILGSYLRWLVAVRVAVAVAGAGETNGMTTRCARIRSGQRSPRVSHPRSCLKSPSKKTLSGMQFALILHNAQS